jgi:hypothetical protein
MKALLKTLAHAAFGAAATTLGAYAGGPITTKTVILPALGSAITSVISLIAQNPWKVFSSIGGQSKP